MLLCVFPGPTSYAYGTISGGFRGGPRGHGPPNAQWCLHLMLQLISAFTSVVSQNLVVKSAYVSVTTDRTLDCIVKTLNYVFLNSFAVFSLIPYRNYSFTKYIFHIRSSIG